MQENPIIGSRVQRRSGLAQMTAVSCKSVGGIALRNWSRSAALRLALVLPIALLACLPGSARSQENLQTIQASSSANPRTSPSRGSAGLWQGVWEVTRDHPQVRTRAGALALRLDIEHRQASAVPRVRWTADRALCESPTESPCEWVGSHGTASSARVVDGHLLVVLSVSADEGDPMVVWLERPQQGRSATGTLISARGDLAYTLQAQRP